MSEFSPNVLKIKTLTTLARTDTQYIHYYQQSMCAQERGVTGTQGNRPRKSSPASITAAEVGPPALLVTMAGKSKLAFTSGLMFQKFWSHAPCAMIFFSPSTAWRVFASLMS